MYNFGANPYPPQQQRTAPHQQQLQAPYPSHTRPSTSPQPPSAASSQQQPTPTIANLQSAPSKQFASIIFEQFMYQIIEYYQKHNDADNSAAANGSSKDHMISKLDTLGYRLGERLSEVLLHNTSIFSMMDSLEKIKYLCKDIWLYIYHKQMDKLQTNYKGIYVLHDFHYKWVSHVIPNSPDTIHQDLYPYTILPCALMRGILSAIGMNVTIKADASKWPTILFTVVDTDMTARLASATASTANPTSTSTSPAHSHSHSFSQSHGHKHPPTHHQHPPTQQRANQQQASPQSQQASSVTRQLDNMSISQPRQGVDSAHRIASNQPQPQPLPSPAEVERSSSQQLLAYYTANADSAPSSTFASTSSSNLPESTHHTSTSPPR